MIIAIEKGTNTSVELLIKKDPKIVNVRFPNGSYPLCIAAYHFEAEKIDILLKNGANESLCTSEGKTAYNIFVEEEHNANEYRELLEPTPGTVVSSMIRYKKPMPKSAMIKTLQTIATGKNKTE